MRRGQAGKNGKPRFCSVSAIIVGVPATSWRRKIIIITDIGVDHVYLAESSRAPSLSPRPGLINCQFGVGWFQLLSATTASLRSTDAGVINGCLAPACRGRKVWIFLRELQKMPFAKMIAAASPANRIHKLWHGSAGPARATDLAIIPADLSAPRDCAGRMMITTCAEVDALCEWMRDGNVPG